MPAQIIESRPRPFSRVELDPITLDIIENAMLNARWEMDAVLFRTAMSPGIREQHDEFPMIANLDGKMVVGQFGSFIHGFKEAYDGTIEEGDMFLTTDPYACNGAVSHANDWLLLRPIYKDGRLIAYASMFGHMTDIGGQGSRQLADRCPGGSSRKAFACLRSKILQERRASGRRAAPDSAQLPASALESQRLQRHRGRHPHRGEARIGDGGAFRR